jgi:hypothetical protein
MMVLTDIIAWISLVPTRPHSRSSSDLSIRPTYHLRVKHALSLPRTSQFRDFMVFPSPRGRGRCLDVTKGNEGYISSSIQHVAARNHDAKGVEGHVVSAREMIWINALTVRLEVCLQPQTINVRGV